MDVDKLTIEDGLFEDIKKEFMNVWKETYYGFEKDNFSDHDKTLFVCDKDMVFQNLKLVSAFCAEARRKFLNMEDYRKTIIRETDNIFKVIPEILSNQFLLSCLVAYTPNFSNKISVTENIGKFKTKEILLLALRENPNCYQYFSEKFRNDIDICKDAVQLGEIHDVIQYGPISEKDWKEVILEKLSEFEN